MDRQRVQTHKALGQEKRAKSSVLSPRERESGRERRGLCVLSSFATRKGTKKRKTRGKSAHTKPQLPTRQKQLWWMSSSKADSSPALWFRKHGLNSLLFVVVVVVVVEVVVVVVVVVV